MADNIVGKDVKITFYVDNAPVVVKCKNINVEEVATEVADGINGDDRDELQSITNFFRISFSGFKDSPKLLRALLANKRNDDAGLAQLNKAVGIRFSYRDGTRAVFVAKEMTLDPFSIDVSGRTERVMQQVKCRARYFDEVKAA